jgi:putative glutamine amidotransferase
MSARLPVIGVISCSREVEGEPAQAVKHRYLEAVLRYADAVPVILPNNQPTRNATAIVERIDALLLTGSNSNMSPNRYGGAAADTPPVDEGRDGFGLALVAACIDAGRPVLGVCRGLQEINVAFGGSLRDLRRDGAAAGAHHAPEGVALESMFAHAHRVRLAPESSLARLTAATDLEVNSVHDQAIDRLGDRLAIDATSDDGIIEAIHATDTAAPVIAVQWHPEWRPEGRPHDI